MVATAGRFSIFDAAVLASAFLQEVNEGPPMRGVPFALRVPPAEASNLSKQGTDPPYFHYIQGNNNARGSDATALTVAYPGWTVKGNLLVCAVAYYNANSGVVVSDNLNGTWQQAPKSPQTEPVFGSNHLAFWYLENSAEGYITVSVAQAGASNAIRAAAIGEWSGAAKHNVIRSATLAATNTSANPATPTCTAQQGDLVIAAYSQSEANMSRGGVVATPFAMRQEWTQAGVLDGVGIADDLNAGSSEGATFTLPLVIDNWLAMAISVKPFVTIELPGPEISGGPNARGIPWETHLPAEGGNLVILAPPVIVTIRGAPSLEIRRSPPMRGGPIPQRIEPHESSSLFVPAPPAQTASPSVNIEIRTGPGRFAPWAAVRVPVAEGLGAVPQKPVPVPPTPGPGRLQQKPMLERVPDTSDERRLSRFTEKLSGFFNSLVSQGIIVQTGAGWASWALRPGGFAMPRPPAVTDDITQGVQIGAVWVDTNAGQAYLCVRNLKGVAQWKQFTV